MPQFPRRNTQPMRPESYRRIAREIRVIAARLDECAEGADPHQKQRLTVALNSLMRQSRAWRARHQATVDGTLYIQPDWQN
jgi:hypothetical protein